MSQTRPERLEDKPHHHCQSLHGVKVSNLSLRGTANASDDRVRRNRSGRGQKIDLTKARKRDRAKCHSGGRPPKDDRLMVTGMGMCCAQVSRGGICPRSLGRGVRSTPGFGAGARRGCGHVCSLNSAAERTARFAAWTAPTSRSTKTPPTQPVDRLPMRWAEPKAASKPSSLRWLTLSVARLVSRWRPANNTICTPVAAAPCVHASAPVRLPGSARPATVVRRRPRPWAATARSPVRPAAVARQPGRNSPPSAGSRWPAPWCRQWPP